MTSFIEYKEGTVYDPAHLRPFDLELAKQGHPLAYKNGDSIRLFRVMSIFEGAEFFAWDEWGDSKNNDGYALWRMCPYSENAEELLKALRLAPLAVKDGKPLHVGDVIEICANIDNWFDVPYLEHHNTEDYLRWVNDYEWRWPVEVKA